MVPLQHLLKQDWTLPIAMVVIVYTVVSTIYQHIKERGSEQYPKGIMGSLRETAEALLLIGSIWVLQFAMDNTIGTDYKAAGVDFHAILDLGHLAIAVRWLTKCLLRFWI